MRPSRCTNCGRLWRSASFCGRRERTDTDRAVYELTSSGTTMVQARHLRTGAVRWIAAGTHVPAPVEDRIVVRSPQRVMVLRTAS